MKTQTLKTLRLCLLMGVITIGIPTKNYSQIRKPTVKKPKVGISQGSQSSSENKTENTSNSDTSAKDSDQSVSTSSGKDYYVSANTGRGRIGSKEQPARDLSSIISLLAPGDRVHIAEGYYEAKGGEATYELKVPVSIIGGYNSQFTERDPWGKYQTIFGGAVDTPGKKVGYRFRVETGREHKDVEMNFDGFIIDRGNESNYHDYDQDKLNLKREASPESGRVSTPVYPAFAAKCENCIVNIKDIAINNAHGTNAALNVALGSNSSATINNCLITNYSGQAGINLVSTTASSDSPGNPKFSVKNTTIAFGWRGDKLDERSGNGIRIADDRSKVLIENCAIIGMHGVAVTINLSGFEKPIVRNCVLSSSNIRGQFSEFGTVLRTIEDLEDYSEHFSLESSGNEVKPVQVNIDDTWSNYYISATQKLPPPGEVYGKVEAPKTIGNELRSLLGMNLQANPVASDIKIWCHGLELNEALKVGAIQYSGAGCQKP